MLLLPVLAAVGCQSFHAVPLTTQAVNESLIPPSDKALHVEAANLSHPILRPLSLDLRKGLTPRSAGVLAVLVNPQLKALRDQRAIAGAQLLQAKLLPNPTFNAGVDVPTDGSIADAVTGSLFGVNWDVRSILDHSAKVAAASKHRQQIDLAVAWREWEVAERAKTAVYRLVAARREAELAAKIYRHLADNLLMLEQAARQRQRSAMDVVAAEQAAQQARAKMLRLRANVQQARLQLNQLLGLPSSRPVKLSPNISLPSHVDLPGTAVLLKGLEQRRLDLVALRRGYASQQQHLRQAIIDQFPRINVGLNHQRGNDNIGTVGLSLSIALPVFDQNQGAIARARATRKQLFDQYVSRVFTARHQIASSVMAIRSLNERVRTAQQAIPTLRNLADAYRVAVRQGQADVLSYYTAWRNLADTQVEILDLRQQLVARQIALQVDAGLYELDSIKSSPASRPTKSRHQDEATQ